MTNAAGYAQQGVDLFHGHVHVAAELRYDYFRFNPSIDNLTDKRYFETQNYFESRVSPGAEARARIHGTPGYPVGVSVGLTFRLGAKD
ncbi:MAG TPA: hypothetical protein VG324_17975 [Blastocatellia bacterium]|nr:hypothetical protein [Blastocatellia bacterium]